MSTNQPCNNTGLTVLAIFLFIALLVTLGFLIWGWTRNTSDQRLDIPDAVITGNAGGIYAVWGKLDDASDKVTLYASEEPIGINPDGTVTGTIASSTVNGDTGNTSITVGQQGLKINTTYYVALVVTNGKTVHYHIFNALVYTQTLVIGTNFLTVAPPGPIVTVETLSQKGGIDQNASYTKDTKNIAPYQHVNSELVAVFEDIDDTSSILAHYNGKLVVADKDIETGAVTYTNSCGETTCIDATQTKWAYNSDGLNKWCLTTPEEDGRLRCMAVNVNSTTVNVVSNDYDKWANPLTNNNT